MTAALVDMARIKSGMRVLDLASGDGNPALTLAGLVDRCGTVTATDINAAPLETAAARAYELGLGNICFQVADAGRLPFAAGLFDRVTCRFGLMFFADPVEAMREAGRVLKPRGRLALAVWGSMQQPFFQVFLAPVLRHAGGPVLPDQGPDPFKFAQPGSLSRVLREAGFREVEERAETVKRVWPGSPEAAWQFFRDRAAPFRPLMDRVPADQWEDVTREIVVGVTARRVASGYDFEARIVLAAADKT